MPRRFNYADDDPVLKELDGMSNEILAGLRTDYSNKIRVRAAATSKLYARLTRIASLLRSRKNGGFEITDHAVIRYMERVQGVDVNALRRMIVKGIKSSTGSKDVKGDAVGLVVGGLTYVVVEGYKVVTIHPPEEEDVEETSAQE